MYYRSVRIRKKITFYSLFFQANPGYFATCIVPLPQGKKILNFPDFKIGNGVQTLGLFDY
jgi:hypothetical protein